MQKRRSETNLRFYNARERIQEDADKEKVRYIHIFLNLSYLYILLILIKHLNLHMLFALLSYYRRVWTKRRRRSGQRSSGKILLYVFLN